MLQAVSSRQFPSVRWQISQAEGVHHCSKEGLSRRKVIGTITVPLSLSAQLQTRSLTISIIGAGQHQVTSRRLHRQKSQGSQITNSPGRLHECHLSPNRSSRRSQVSNIVHVQLNAKQLGSNRTTKRLRFGTTGTVVKSVALQLIGGNSAVCKVACTVT